MPYLGLSRRALLDMLEIESYSVEQWGEAVAAQYMQSIEDALKLLRNNPDLLNTKPNISQSLCFYRVRQHFLVCAVYEKNIFVLTEKHGAMDLPNRIAEVEPQLILEADALYSAFQAKAKGK
jgi:plasmid stabilization system protein ParE